jgi:hypothetical protein
MTSQPRGRHRATDNPGSPGKTPDGPLSGGAPDDQAESSTPGSDGDGPEAGYTAPDGDDRR